MSMKISFSSLMIPDAASRILRRFDFRRSLMRATMLAFFGSCALPLAFSQQADDARINAPRMVLPRNTEARDPVRLTEMEVQARIVGLNAEVTTTMTFLNPNMRPLEGELVFPLPEGTGVTGYALDIKGQMVDGVVVKKEKARVAFETEVRRGVDPGLVEHVAGNVFRTRVYPLPAGGVRRVRVRSVGPLSIDTKGDAAWSLPMPLGETIGKLNIRVEVSQGAVTPTIGGFGNLRFESFDNVWVAHTELQDAKPGEDIRVALPKLPPQVASIEQTRDGDTYFSLSDLPAAEASPVAAKPPARIGIAWDASGSRGGDKHLEREIAMLKELLSAWPDTGVTLLVFRDHPEEARVFDGNRDSLLKTLGELAYDGGTDLAAVPDAMNKMANVDQWLLFTDGLDTLSGRLPDFGKHHVTAVVSQTVADRELLDQVCAGGGGQVVDLQNLEPGVAAAAIINPPLRLAAVHGSGIADAQGVGQVVHGRAGICGRLTGEETELMLEYSDGHRSPPVKIAKSRATAGELLASVWAGRRIHQLSVRADDNEDELLSLGQRFGIVSPATSLIVLETLDQYTRNDIEPPASLPELRRMWAENKANQAKVQDKTRADKLERLLAMWNARVEWWNTDFKGKQDVKMKKDSAWGVQSDVNRSVTDNSAMQDMERSNPVSQMQAPVAGAAPAAPSNVHAAVRSSSSLNYYAAELLKAGGGNVYTGDTVVTAGALSLAKADEKTPGGGSPESTITIKAWDPATPYLRALKAAGKEARYTTYLKFRKDYKASPAFFLDCADYFFREGERETAIRVLTNLAELKLEEASLLRVLAWRFQQAGELDRAIVVLRKVLKLRPEEPQSLRDLALALSERGKTSRHTSDLSEALALEEKLLYGEWPRFEDIELIVLEEMNALITWIHGQAWDKSPVIPDIDKRLLKNLDEDVRIVMSWDADATDVDLHVIEPTGEEAFYSHNRTRNGGLVSHDITQGYGPEEYLMRKALPGTFKIFAQYYGSHQQTLTGPVTVTATVFTNFGRANEKKEVLTLRLDKPHEKADIGKVRFDIGKDQAPTEAAADSRPRLSREDFSALKAGQPQQETLRLLGEPEGKNSDTWTYEIGKRRYRVQFSKQATVQSVVESLPGGAEMILAQ
jgi:tetratricopeptide (TPR) repeat protein